MYARTSETPQLYFLSRDICDNAWRHRNENKTSMDPVAAVLKIQEHYAEETLKSCDSFLDANNNVLNEKSFWWWKILISPVNA